MAERWYVYILRCGDNSLYTGITNDLGRRIAQHEAGTGAKYTRGRGPLRLEAKRRFASKSVASQVEARVKRAKSEEKIQLLRKLRAPPALRA